MLIWQGREEKRCHLPPLNPHSSLCAPFLSCHPPTLKGIPLWDFLFLIFCNGRKRYGKKIIEEKEGKK